MEIIRPETVDMVNTWRKTYGDAKDVIVNIKAMGSPAWRLWLFGLVTIPLGLRLWHGLGKHFGLGTSDGRVQAGAAYATSGLLLLTVLLEIALSGR